MSLNRCPECSFPMGQYFQFIDEAKRAIYADTIYSKDSKYANYDPEKMIFNGAELPSLANLFDELGIKNRCCRMHITGRTDFDKRYL